MNQDLIDFVLQLNISEGEKVTLFELIRKENKINLKIDFTNASFNLIQKEEG